MEYESIKKNKINKRPPLTIKTFDQLNDDLVLKDSKIP